MGESDEDGVDGVSRRREGRIGTVIGDHVGVGHMDRECDAHVLRTSWPTAGSSTSNVEAARFQVAVTHMSIGEKKGDQ